MDISNIFWEARNDLIDDLIPLTQIITDSEKELFSIFSTTLK